MPALDCTVTTTLYLIQVAGLLVINIRILQSFSLASFVLRSLAWEKSNGHILMAQMKEGRAESLISVMA